MTLDYQGWHIEIKEQLMTVTKENEIREYDLPKYKSIIIKGEYVTIESEDSYIQYKMEVDNFFVGDKFDNEDEHIETMASHVFGEE